MPPDRFALATLELTIHKNRRAYAALECRSVMLGAAVAFFVYAVTVSWVLRGYKVSALGASLTLIPLWFLASFCHWHFVGRA